MKTRPLRDEDLILSDRLMREAFGTYLGLPNPQAFMGDADFTCQRMRSPACSGWALEDEGQLVGSNIATRWGSFASFGPLAVSPRLQNKGGAKALLAPTLDTIDSWGSSSQAIYTFANSPKHLHLYAGFGFRPYFLTAIASKPLAGFAPLAQPWDSLANQREGALETMILDCGKVAESVLSGLDLKDEIRGCLEQGLGDVLLAPSREAFALCHSGAGSEAGSGKVYVKFGAVKPGPAARRGFAELLAAAANFGRQRGATELLVGINAGCREAYQHVVNSGFRSSSIGVELRRGPADLGWNRPDNFVLADLR